MISKDELITEALPLPVELRIQLVDKLLESLNSTNKDIDELWAIEAERRVAEIEQGEIGSIYGEELFRNLYDRLKK